MNKNSTVWIHIRVVYSGKRTLHEEFDYTHMHTPWRVQGGMLNEFNRPAYSPHEVLAIFRCVDLFLLSCFSKLTAFAKKRSRVVIWKLITFLPSWAACLLQPILCAHIFTKLSTSKTLSACNSLLLKHAVKMSSSIFTKEKSVPRGCPPLSLCSVSAASSWCHSHPCKFGTS